MEASSLPALHKPESRFGIEFSPVEFPAAIQAGHRASKPADPWEILSAAGQSLRTFSVEGEAGTQVGFDMDKRPEAGLYFIRLISPSKETFTLPVAW